MAIIETVENKQPNYFVSLQQSIGTFVVVKLIDCKLTEFG